MQLSLNVLKNSDKCIILLVVFILIIFQNGSGRIIFSMFLMGSGHTNLRLGWSSCFILYNKMKTIIICALLLRPFSYKQNQTRQPSFYFNINLLNPKLLTLQIRISLPIAEVFRSVYPGHCSNCFTIRLFNQFIGPLDCSTMENCMTQDLVSID